MTTVAGFDDARECLEQIVSWLDGADAAGLAHADLEADLDSRGRELLRLLLQDHLVLRAAREEPIVVVNVDGQRHGRVEPGHVRLLATVFGVVDVERLAYRRLGAPNLHPADGVLNLPVERHSHGLRRLAAVEATRGSFADAVDAVERATGQHVGKRQVEQLAARAATDIDAFYAEARREPAANTDVVVLSVDGKGIVMRPDSLRPKTAEAAAGATTKLDRRLSKGEKRNRKRMAEVGAVYDLTPVPRTAEQLMDAGGGGERQRPRAKAKWLCASVVDDAAEVIAQVFDEAERRDPLHQRRWIVLVDGNRHQIDCVQAQADHRHLDVTILCDLVHVLEYLWGAAWCFYPEGDRTAEQWVKDRALAVLHGRATDVAAGIRRRATTAALTKAKRRKADACARYLVNQARYLDYPTALAEGWPLATGIIEGACRHLICDRMDLTGARWTVNGAEAVLKLRALNSNGDFDTYWRYHLDHERHRVHDTRYTDDTIPLAA